MILKELISFLDKRLEIHTGQDWDNNGLLVGDENSEISKILFALELTENILKEALELKVNLIVVHHPVIFSGLKKVVNSGSSKLVFELVENKIALYAAHTNFDALQGGLNDYLVNLLQGFNISTIPAQGEEYGLLRVFSIPKITLEELSQNIKKNLDISGLRYIGDPQAIISKIGVVTGSGSEYISLAYENGAQAFITGDIKYHQAQEYKEKGFNVIDAGHFETEQTFSKAIYNLIGKDLEEKSLEIYLSEKEENPFIFS